MSTASAGAAGIPLRRSSDLILIMETPKGRGVFAAKDIPAHTILDVCPVLVLDPVENEEHIRETQLYNYTYDWPYTAPPGQEKPKTNNSSHYPPSTTLPMTQAIVFGLGSMFNHSNLNQNVGWDRDLKNQLITYTSLRPITAGEELCISYGARLTFRDTEEELDVGPEDWSDVMNIIGLID